MRNIQSNREPTNLRTAFFDATDSMQWPVVSKMITNLSRHHHRLLYRQWQCSDACPRVGRQDGLLQQDALAGSSAVAPEAELVTMWDTGYNDTEGMCNR